jgi:tetratricopeptide (TPR) repeat protein
VLHTAPFEHWEWHEAARLLGDAAVAHDPAAAAQWLELSLLDDLRSYFHLLRDTDYLRTPAAIHRLQAAAAIDAGDFAAAAASARLALKAAPGETEICEQLVPRLEQAGQHQAADELFELQFDQHVQWVETWPGSARLHNNLAWLAARCDRRLDQALHHAEEAVQREPANSGYLDTLAEVHFRRGDRETAIDYARRALALEPDSAMLKSQLERFEKE